MRNESGADEIDRTNTEGAMATNRLAQETSPYLQQHSDNPVHWQPWDSEALAMAERENKPILLSVGYAACHWCHVMAHESFDNPDIARLMNDLFINIKVDREERPDIDGIYQHALSLLGQHGGWPLTMFLTPTGHPFWGGTYFPPESRYGRPGFPDVLKSVARIYSEEPEKVTQNVDALREAMRKLSSPERGSGIPDDIVDAGTRQLLGNIDHRHGGLQGAPKFPQPGLMGLLWNRYRRTGDGDARAAVLHSLNRMLQGGIYDHVGGGLARYAVDEQWLAPHFEKMLYDNAQLLELLSAVWFDTSEPLFRVRAEETVDWLLREMRAAPADAGGPRGFASSLDADSEGEEGKFYVWAAAEIDHLLGKDAPMFRAAYDVTAEGNWEGRNILNRSHEPGLPTAKEEKVLARCRAILLDAREKRVRPGWDDKVLADWNGLLVAALARAAFAFRRPDWLEPAQEAFHFVNETMTVAGRHYHSWRGGRLRTPALIEDHAQIARAALALYETVGDPEYLQAARNRVETARRDFWDDEHGGYFQTAADVDDVILRPKTSTDTAIPSGNGAMAEVHARLYHLTGDDRQRQCADAVINAFTGDLERSFFALPSLLHAQQLLYDA
ncbi:MAG: thioredoxin domain-containing protein, partial [Acetobacterales bacterium]